MHRDTAGGLIPVVIGAALLLLMIGVIINLLVMKRRAPQRRTRNMYGMYLTPGQSLKTAPFLLLVPILMIVYGLWAMH